jgi:cytidine deaminase
MVTEEQRDALISSACEVRQQAYAPYSNYLVGAAILAGNGQIFTGVNVENASYGLTICAERSAIFTAAATGVREVLGVAICVEGIGTPCGACRQVMSEFADDIPVWISDVEGNVRQTSLHTLLPDYFHGEHLA